MKNKDIVLKPEDTDVIEINDMKSMINAKDELVDEEEIEKAEEKIKSFFDLEIEKALKRSEWLLKQVEKGNGKEAAQELCEKLGYDKEK